MRVREERGAGVERTYSIVWLFRRLLHGVCVHLLVFSSVCRRLCLWDILFSGRRTACGRELGEVEQLRAVVNSNASSEGDWTLSFLLAFPAVQNTKKSVSQ